MPFSGIRPCIRGLFFIKFSNRSGWIALWITMGKSFGSARPGLKRGRRPASRSLVPEDRRSRLGLDAVRVDIARRHAQLGERLLRHRLLRDRGGIAVRAPLLLDRVSGDRLFIARIDEDGGQKNEDEHERQSRQADANALHLLQTLQPRFGRKAIACRFACRTLRPFRRKSGGLRPTAILNNPLDDSCRSGEGASMQRTQIFAAASVAALLSLAACNQEPEVISANGVEPQARPAERRVGKGGGRTWKFLWSP